MKVVVGWPDGETREVYDVTTFSKSWVGDEWLFVAKHRDGSETHYTGKELSVLSGEEIDGTTQAAVKGDAETGGGCE
jgi:hypothetical protein